jgi:hypothetical protein
MCPQLDDQHLPLLSIPTKLKVPSDLPFGAGERRQRGIVAVVSNIDEALVVKSYAQQLKESRDRRFRTSEYLSDPFSQLLSGVPFFFESRMNTH